MGVDLEFYRGKDHEPGKYLMSFGIGRGKANPMRVALRKHAVEYEEDWGDLHGYLSLQGIIKVALSLINEGVVDEHGTPNFNATSLLQTAAVLALGYYHEKEDLPFIGNDVGKDMIPITRVYFKFTT